MQLGFVFFQTTNITMEYRKPFLFTSVIKYFKFIEGFVWINYHYGRLIWFFNIDSAVLSPDMFPSDLFPQLVNFAEQLFLVPGQGFGYVYFAFGSDTKIGEVNSFLVNKLPSVRIEAIPHIPSRELDYYLWWCIFFKSWQWVRGRYISLLHLYARSAKQTPYVK